MPTHRTLNLLPLPARLIHFPLDRSLAATGRWSPVAAQKRGPFPCSAPGRWRRPFHYRQWLLLACCVALPAGCVRRTLVVRTAPEGALVYLNDEEVGRSPARTDFLWYGDYDVIIRKEGYQTLKTHAKIPAPWYEWPPLDFFSEVLYPGHLHDVHELSYTLQPEQLPDEDELLERAEVFRREAGSPPTAEEHSPDHSGPDTPEVADVPQTADTPEVTTVAPH